MMSAFAASKFIFESFVYRILVHDIQRDNMHSEFGNGGFRGKNKHPFYRVVSSSHDKILAEPWIPTSQSWQMSSILFFDVVSVKNLNSKDNLNSW